MRRSLLAFPLHHVDADADFGVGHVQAELITQHRPELGFVAQVPPFCLARRVPNRHTRIEPNYRFALSFDRNTMVPPT